MSCGELHEPAACGPRALSAVFESGGIPADRTRGAHPRRRRIRRPAAGSRTRAGPDGHDTPRSHRAATAAESVTRLAAEAALCVVRGLGAGLGGAVASHLGLRVGRAL